MKDWVVNEWIRWSLQIVASWLHFWIFGSWSVPRTVSAAVPFFIFAALLVSMEFALLLHKKLRQLGIVCLLLANFSHCSRWTDLNEICKMTIETCLGSVYKNRCYKFWSHRSVIYNFSAFKVAQYQYWVKRFYFARRSQPNKLRNSWQ